MLITKVKDTGELAGLLAGTTLVVRCFGCKEVAFPEDAIDALLAAHHAAPERSARLDYLCRESFSAAYLEALAARLAGCERAVVFSCGVGVQVVARLAPALPVYAGCDTLYLNGFQGLVPQAADCQQCGECYLNRTGGICPITACAKGLLNGPCGGEKNGKCETNPEMDCGWLCIYRRLRERNEPLFPDAGAQVRNYRRMIDGATTATDK